MSNIFRSCPSPVCAQKMHVLLSGLLIFPHKAHFLPKRTAFPNCCLPKQADQAQVKLMRNSLTNSPHTKQIWHTNYTDDKIVTKTLARGQFETGFQHLVNHTGTPQHNQALAYQNSSVQSISPLTSSSSIHTYMYAYTSIGHKFRKRQFFQYSPC